MSTMLEQLGFGDVTFLPNATCDQVEKELRALKQRIDQSVCQQVIVFFFAGHGCITEDGKQHLLMKDRKRISLNDEIMVTLQRAPQSMPQGKEPPSHHIIVMLDCCR